MEDLVKSDVYYWAVVQEDLSGELEKGSVLATLGSSPVVPYANVTLENGQQVTVLLENPKGISLGHNICLCALIQTFYQVVNCNK